MNKIDPACEIEIELQYHKCLKCNLRKACGFAKKLVPFWEKYVVTKFHDRNSQEWEDI